VRRRDFIKVIAGSMAVWSHAARAQQRPKLPTIGFLGANNATFARSSIDAFVQRLRELGWIENQTVAIEYRWAEGHEERFAEIAAEFIRLKVDVIFTYATPSSIAAKKATAVIPIVFAAAGDPVGTGLVASLARPGGNITGLSIQQTDLASKRLELLRQVLPAVRTVAILGDIGSPNSVLEMGEAEAAAGTLGLAVVTSKVRRAEDIAPAFEALKGRVDALYVCSSPPLTTNRIQINSLALGERLPTMYGFREYTVSGGADVLWTKPSEPFSSRRRVCRQDSARGEAWRPAGRAANEVRVHHQSDDRKGAWADDPCIIDVTCRRTNRINTADFRYWPKADILIAWANVRFRG
jgi:putative tryptophan/tyrosine transport system substrate-binding protein